MSSATREAGGLTSTKKEPSNAPVANPFSTAFDDELSDDEWWNEETPTNVRMENATKIELTQWPVPPITAGVARKPTVRNSSHRFRKAYSVKKPTRDKSRGRQRKQNAKAGIKVVTNFSRGQGTAKPTQVPPVRKVGCFVDLATLQALDAEATKPVRGFWSSKAQEPANDLNSQSTQEHPVQSSEIPTSRNQARNLAVSPFSVSDDLSPSDRPIVIGISIPSDNAADHILSPQTAASEVTKIVRSYEYRSPTQVPETPIITITPAEEVSAWSALDSGTTPSPRRRATSILHSQLDRCSDSVRPAGAVPPIPQFPSTIMEGERQKMAAEKSCFSPDSDDGTIWETIDDGIEVKPSRPCTMGSSTDFEDDESPVTMRGGHHAPQDDRFDKHLSISTVATRHRSKGWWNLLTTPFLTRSNTIANREGEDQQVPAVPNLAIAAAKVQDAERSEKMWEKQFSPLTPETSTTISSESWWIPTSTIEQSRNSFGVGKKVPAHQAKHVAQPSSGTLPFVLLADTGLGLHTVSDEEGTPATAERCLGKIKPPRPETLIFASESALVSKEPQINFSSEGPRLNAPLPSVPLPVAVSSGQPTRSGAFRVPTKPSAVATPPPPYSPPPDVFPNYQAVFRPGHSADSQQPMSPGPLTPGVAQMMSSRGAIPMSNVPLATSLRRPINLNSGYPLPPTSDNNIVTTVKDLDKAEKRARKIEDRRQRHEREEVVARRAGGWWRGRGCISKRGCYGRSGAEGRKRRRWYIGLIAGFIILITVIIVLSTTLHRKSTATSTPSQWLNITGFPPIFEGRSTVAAPINVVKNTGCVFPATQWSCDLPKELQTTTAPSRPNFLLNIQWDNSTSANASFANVTKKARLEARGAAGNPVTAGQLIRALIARAQEIVMFVPSPTPPPFAEEVFLGSVTDGIVSPNKAGEPTPFYISFLPTIKLSSGTSRITKRVAQKASNPFPDVDILIPSPSLDSDGTAAPANLLPLPTQQPIRLYDRGLATEHYGFYTYFDRSIFLKSITPLNGSNAVNGEVPADRNGGASESEANFRCTWAQTRFLVQMWTRMGPSARLLNSTLSTQPSNANTLDGTGAFPYPITITTDRHGGDPTLKMLYCYEMNDRQGLIAASGKVNSENRGFGGTLINGAPGVFSNKSDPTLGGFDGGTGGCSCKWQNFQKVTNA